MQDDPASQDLPSVLVVEDHPEMRAHIRACLADHFQVWEAADGLAGLALARAQLPDLIVSDWMMPGMDGKALGSALRQDMATSHIPLVFLTAKASLESRLEGLESGADIYLSKPFHREELLLQLRNLLRRQQAQRQPILPEMPQTPTPPKALSMDAQFLQKVQGVLQRELANERFGVEQMADALGMSRKTLHRKVSAVTGETPNAMIRNFRLEAAMEFLKNKTGPVGEIAYLTGFGSHSYFSKCFQEYFHIAPSEV
jgi:DNA-binding response OmpR family regulator